MVIRCTDFAAPARKINLAVVGEVPLHGQVKFLLVLPLPLCQTILNLFSSALTAAAEKVGGRKIELESWFLKRWRLGPQPPSPGGFIVPSVQAPLPPFKALTRWGPTGTYALFPRRRLSNLRTALRRYALLLVSLAQMASTVASRVRAFSSALVMCMILLSGFSSLLMRSDVKGSGGRKVHRASPDALYKTPIAVVAVTGRFL